MDAKNTIGYYGEVEVSLVDKKTKNVEQEFKSLNQVMMTSGPFMRALFEPGHFVDTLFLGDGGIADGAIKTVDYKETELYHFLDNTALTSPEVTFDQDAKKTTIAFTTIYSHGSVNNVIVNEIGLGKLGGGELAPGNAYQLFAKKTMTEMVLDDTKELVVIWKMHFQFGI